MESPPKKKISISLSKGFKGGNYTTPLMFDKKSVDTGPGESVEVLEWFKNGVLTRKTINGLDVDLNTGKLLTPADNKE